MKIRSSYVLLVVAFIAAAGFSLQETPEVVQDRGGTLDVVADETGGVWVNCGGSLRRYSNQPSFQVCDLPGMRTVADKRTGVWVYCGGRLSYYDREPAFTVCS